MKLHMMMTITANHRNCCAAGSICCRYPRRNHDLSARIHSSAPRLQLSQSAMRLGGG